MTDNKQHDTRTARRPDRVTEYDCEEEMQQSQYTEEEEGFFD